MSATTETPDTLWAMANSEDALAGGFGGNAHSIKAAELRARAAELRRRAAELEKLPLDADCGICGAQFDCHGEAGECPLICPSIPLGSRFTPAAELESAKEPAEILSPKQDARPQRGGWAPGGYMCRCAVCSSRFIGDKRARTCADCAYSQPDPRPAALETLVDVVAQIENELPAIRNLLTDALATLRDMMGLVESGDLVRSTHADGNTMAFVAQTMKIAVVLKDAGAVLARAEGRGE